MWVAYDGMQEYELQCLSYPRYMYPMDVLLQAFILEMNGDMWCAWKDESLVFGHKCEGRGSQGLSEVGG